MILTLAVDDAIVKVVDIVALPGAIVMDSIDERLTTALTFCAQFGRIPLLACSWLVCQLFWQKCSTLGSAVRFYVFVLHRLLWLVTTRGLFNSFSKRGLYPRDVCFS